MPNCNFNGCYTGPNYPRGVFTRNCNNVSCGRGRVINPEIPLEFGVFENVESQNVLNEEPVLFSLSTGSGTAIKDGTNGEIDLTAGVYRVSYNAVVEIPSGGVARLISQFDGDNILTSQTASSGSEEQVFSLSNQFILNINEAGTLRIINNSGESVNILSVNVSINKLWEFAC